MVRTLIVCVGFVAAGMLAGASSAHAQSQQDVDQASTAHGASAPAAAAKPKSKKVWTNDDMSSVSGTISVVGTPQQPASGPRTSVLSSPPLSASPAKAKQDGATKADDNKVDEKTLAELRQQLQKLQSSIDALDKQIDQLRGMSKGDSKNVGGLNPDTWSYSTASVPDKIKSLESKRSELQAAMDNLLDAARASGIEPGQLR